MSQKSRDPSSTGAATLVRKSISEMDVVVHAAILADESKCETPCPRPSGTNFPLCCVRAEIQEFVRLKVEQERQLLEDEPASPNTIADLSGSDRLLLSPSALPFQADPKAPRAGAMLPRDVWLPWHQRYPQAEGPREETVVDPRQEASRGETQGPVQERAHHGRLLRRPLQAPLPAR